MNQVTQLRNALRPHLSWHGARISFLATFLIALLRVKTVNLAELATAFSGTAQIDSHYKRLQRFFRNFEMDYGEMAQTVVALMSIPEPWVLAIDRTEWKFGEGVFNVLMLAIVHEGIAFPVTWTLLDKRGCSNSHERMEIFNTFLEQFRGRKLACLTADREFVGKDWFDYLLGEPNTPFRIRIRKDHMLSDGKSRLRVGVLFADLAIGQRKVLRHKRLLWGHWLYIGAVRLADGELLVIATQTAPHSALTDYAQRWGIETLFGILKTRGFCLESTHLNNPGRLGKLIGLLTLALCWIVLTGEWVNQFKPLGFKKHGRKAKSIFRYGFDYLRNIVVNLNEKNDDFLNVLQLLSCT